MNYSIAIALVPDKLLGLIPAAFLLDEKVYSKMKIIKRLDKKDLNTSLISGDSFVKELVNICEFFDYDFLLHKINKKAKKITLAEFLKTSDNSTKKYLESQIDIKKNELLKIVLEHKILLFFRANRIEDVSDDDIIDISVEKAVVKFDFQKKSETLYYKLHLYFENKEIDLIEKNIYLFTNKNASVIYDNKLLFFENTTFNGNKIKPFLKKPEIIIKASLQGVFFEKFIAPVVKDYEYNITGFDLNKMDVEPLPKLKIEKTFTNQIVLTPIFKYLDKNIVFYKKQRLFVDVIFEDNIHFLRSFSRNIDKENTYLKELSKLGLKAADKYFYNPDIKDDKHLFISYFSTVLPKLKQLGFTVENHLFNKDISYQEWEIKYHSKQKLDWFDLYIKITIGKFTIPFIDFKNHIINNIYEFQLPDDTIFIIPKSWFSELYSLALRTLKDNRTTVFKNHLPLVKKNKLISPNSEMASALEKMEIGSPMELPKTNIASLRYYQKIGYQWLYQLTQNGFGLCIADDMGLGKTLQVVTVLQKYFENKSFSADLPKVQKLQLSLFEPEIAVRESAIPALIIMPKSLIFNWIEELKKFAPELSYWVYHGQNRTQKLDENINSKHLMLTTYGVVSQDIHIIKDLEFSYLIADESQAFKNPDSKIFKSIIELNGLYRISITGTPIENSIRDLYSQMKFLNGDILGNRQYFEKHYFQSANEEMMEKTIDELNTITSPFILRRLKNEVAEEFPAKSEQIIYCDMEDQQKELYESKKSAIRNELLFEGSKSKNVIGALSFLNKLRQLAIHPALIDTSYERNSGKFNAIIQVVDNLISQGHKFLIFSSFVKHLNIIKTYLENNNIEYSMLTGKDHNRQKIVENFQTNPKIKPFLISIKAGGVGLNLTAANYVLIIDPWWNPAVERQAIDRTHRIGQDKNVFVYKFITKNSIEEKMLILQNRKLKLIDNLIDKPSVKINYEEILGLVE